MAIRFDGSGRVEIPEWVSTSGNFDIIVEGDFPLGDPADLNGLLGGNDVGGIDWLLISGPARLQIRSDGAYNSNIGSALNDRYIKIELRCRTAEDVTTLSVYFDEVLEVSFTGSGYADYSVNKIGDAWGRMAQDGAIMYRVQLVDLDSVANSRDYQFSETSGVSTADSGAGSQNGTLTGFSDPNAAWVSSGPSITAASNITDETQPATITLANNENAPTAIQINGQGGSNIAFISEDTEAGTETYSYLPPLIADDAEAELSVSVDGDTLTTTISYANSYDREQLTHPATEAEYSTNSLSYPNAYGTSLAYEWKVVADASAAVVVIDWDALEADDGFFKDIAGYATPVANGSTTVTLGVFVPETGEAYQFDRTINVSDGSVVVTGQGLWRELFRDPTEELFTELFR
ncbi:hypothetical protein [Marinobacter shengliensis]|uniref:IPT/TIG domain-containing protein n=1 Tax=Marinobacter shengliensis TaxID=1389223 RepID=A0ABV4WBW5_9GAMM